MNKSQALVELGNYLGSKLITSPLKIPLSEIQLTDTDYANPSFASLQGKLCIKIFIHLRFIKNKTFFSGIPLSNIRYRYGILVDINKQIEGMLGFIDLKSSKAYPNSIARLINDLRRIIFYEVKVKILFLFCILKKIRVKERVVGGQIYSENQINLFSIISIYEQKNIIKVYHAMKRNVLIYFQTLSKIQYSFAFLIFLYLLM